MTLLLWLKHFFEYVGGCQDAPPPGLRLPVNSLWWGLWWGLLLCVIVAFCGQTSKFIYIDF